MISRDGERIPVSREERNRRAKIYDYYGASGVIDKIDGYLFDKPLLLKPYVTGTAQPKMNQAKMNSIPVALPPLAEQHRIVVRVGQLMGVCDRLEARLAEGQADGRRLVEAVLHQAINGRPQ